MAPRVSAPGATTGSRANSPMAATTWSQTSRPPMAATMSAIPRVPPVRRTRDPDHIEVGRREQRAGRSPSCLFAAVRSGARGAPGRPRRASMRSFYLLAALLPAVFGCAITSQQLQFDTALAEARAGEFPAQLELAQRYSQPDHYPEWQG